MTPIRPREEMADPMAAEPENETGPVDTPPTGGVFEDWNGAQHDPAMILMGNQLGRDIDPDDDDDNGGV